MGRTAVGRDLETLVRATTAFAHELRDVACRSRHLVRELRLRNAYGESACVVDSVLDEAMLGFLRLQPAVKEVLSEESGYTRLHRDGYSVLIDPLDGTRNYCMGLSYYATTVAFLDADGVVRASVVVNLASGQSFSALRGGGAICDRAPLTTTPPPDIGQVDAIFVGLAVASHQLRTLGRIATHVSSFRATGCAALDLCCLASGAASLFVDISGTAKIVDVLASALIAQEAGALVHDATGAPLVEVTEGGGDLADTVYGVRPLVLGATSKAMADWLASECHGLRTRSAEPALVPQRNGVEPR
jgi:myo-inositol-1(or 4)-monophosphatase